jgi:hypothetical protein
MKYLLLIYMEENAMSDTEREHCYVESAQVAQDLHTKGQFVASAPLHPVATATSVQVRDGKSLVTDGPFAETREQLGGFFLSMLRIWMKRSRCLRYSEAARLTDPRCTSRHRRNSPCH